MLSGYRDIVAALLAASQASAAAWGQPAPVQPAAVPAPGAPAAGNPSEALPPEEAARRLLELCIDHSLGNALIAPAAVQQLKARGFQLTDERSPSEVKGYSGYTVLISTTKGVVKAYASQRGYCEVTATGSPAAPIEKAFTALLEKPMTFAFEKALPDSDFAYGMNWRWRRPGQDLNAFLFVHRDAPTNTVSARIVKIAPGADPD